MSAIDKWRNTYAGYSVGCAGVWGLILLLAQRRADPRTGNAVRLVCGGWWMGWTSATIARAVYPPPKPLGPATEKRIRIVSSVLVAVGIINVLRVLAGAKRSPTTAPGV
ncbi:MAG TPA: hypothetical protein VGI55_17080 [Solirubrobacteraceae bacterium]